MASDAPSWAEQWGTGGIGAMEDESSKTESDAKKVNDKGGLTKAKAVAQKLKSGTSNSFKWIKNQCQKKGSSK